MHGSTRPTVLAAALVTASMLLAACSGGVDPLLESGAARNSAPTAEQAADTPDGQPPAPIVGVTDTVVGWITEEDESSLDPSVIAALATPRLDEATASIGGLVGPIAQIRQSGPLTVDSIDITGPESTVQLTTARDIAVTLRLQASPDGRLSGIQALPDAPDVTSFDEAADALDALGTDVSYVASRATGGTCTPVEEIDADESGPLASVAKLYVLGAVARAVENGLVGWDEQLTVTDARKSAPSGQLQNAPDGTPVTVRQAAESMIAISDNTATDLLIDRIGRAAVENEVVTMGHSNPADLTPFPTTREFFLLGWGLPDGRDAWRDADTAERRTILDGLENRTIDNTVVDPAQADLDYEGIVTRPGAPDGVGWTGSTNDICSAYAALAVGPQSQVVREILALNPGSQTDPAQFPYVGFKGGNAPGEAVGSWLLTDATGQDWVVATQLADDQPIGTLETAYAFTVAEQTFALLPR